MRQLGATFRAEIEDPNNPDPALVFITFDHETWDDPKHFNWDVRNYEFDGKFWIGFPFQLVLPGDGESSPQGSLAIQNVDREIGETIKALRDAPTVEIQIYSAVDFDLTVDPAVPLGTPARAYHAQYLFLREITVDAMSVQGQLMSWDYIQEPWPSRRATSALLPGLYL